MLHIEYALNHTSADWILHTETNSRLCVVYLYGEEYDTYNSEDEALGAITSKLSEGDEVYLVDDKIDKLENFTHYE